MLVIQENTKLRVPFTLRNAISFPSLSFTSPHTLIVAFKSLVLCSVSLKSPPHL